MAEDDKDLEEAKRIMARMLSMPPKPHKAESEARRAQKPARKPKAAKDMSAHLRAERAGRLVTVNWHGSDDFCS